MERIRLRLGPLNSDRDKIIALQEVQNKINELFDLAETGNLVPAVSVTWDLIEGKPTEFNPSEHQHDDLYYRKTQTYSQAEVDDLIADSGDNLAAHLADLANPHAVTKAQVGLGSVENTALSTWPGTNNIVTVGTIGTGVWQGTPVAAAFLGAHTHDWADITGEPATFPPSAHTHPPADLTGFGAAGGYLRSDAAAWVRVSGIAWTDLTGVPATFAPSAHTHPPADITGFGADGGYLRSNAAAWVRVSGLALADATGNLAYARLPTGSGSWDMGAGNALTLPQLTFMTNATVKLVIGHTASLSIANGNSGTGTLLEAALQVHGLDAATSTLGFTRWSANNSPPAIVFAKSRGATPGSLSILSAGDQVGTIVFAADDGTNLGSHVARITALVSASPAPSASRMPGDLAFLTAPGAANDDVQQAMRITNDGRVLVGIATAAQTLGGQIIRLQVHGLSGDAGGGGGSFVRWVNSAIGPTVMIGKSRGTTIGSFTTLASADAIGHLEFIGSDGTDMATVGARISAIVASAPATSRMPTYLGFFTSAGTADDDIAEKMRLGPLGNLGLTAAAKIYLDGVALTGNTYITESSADVLDLVAGGATTLRLNATDAVVTGKLKVSSFFAANNKTPAAAPDYTITNPSTLRTIDVTAGTLSDALRYMASMSQDLIDIGIFQ